MHKRNRQVWQRHPESHRHRCRCRCCCQIPFLLLLLLLLLLVTLLLCVLLLLLPLGVRPLLPLMWSAAPCLGLWWQRVRQAQAP
jgi:hypothetical protein